MNLKKLLTGGVAVATGLATMVGAGFGNASMLNDPELKTAVDWMFENELTRYDNVNDFNPMGILTREQASKFFGAYAVSNLCMAPDASMSCDFSDINDGDSSLKSSIIAACRLGLVKGSNGMYYPTDDLTKAGALTIISRAISAAAGVDAPVETMTPWWEGHFTAMRDLGITKESDVYAVDRPLTRYEAGLMLYRARYDECEEDIDFTDILEDILDVDDSDDSDDSDDTDDNTSANTGELEVELSSNTPAGKVLAGRSNVAVATFDVTADSDATLKSLTLERVGLGSDDAVQRVTLYVDGVAVSRSKSFDSDDEANVSLKPSLDIDAGDTVEVTVVAEIGCGALEPGGPSVECGSASDLANNQEFAIALVEVNDDVVDMITANLFEVGAVNASKIEITVDEIDDEVQVGDKDVELVRFDADNKSDYDVTITQVTLEDSEGNMADAAENFVLEFDGDVVATLEEVNGDFITFILDTPVVIEEGNEEEFVVYADIVAGIDDDIKLKLDEENYVMGYDSKFGAGLWIILVTTYDDADVISITAGDVTIEEIDIEDDIFRQDQEDIILAEFDLTVNAGEDVVLEDISFVVSIDDTAAFASVGDLSDLFDDIEIIVDGDSENVQDVDVADGNKLIFDDLDISIDTATVVNIKVVAEAGSSLEDYVGTIVELTLNATDMNLVDDAENEDITDIAPSVVVFDDVTLVVAMASINNSPLGNIVTVVGTEDLVLIEFEVESDDSSSLNVKEFVFSNLQNFSDDYIVSLELQRETASGWTTVDDVQSGNDINGGDIDFDFDVEVPVLSSQLFRLVVELSSNEAFTGNLQVELSDADIEDDDNEDINVDPYLPIAGRVITVQAAGRLNIELDQTNIDDAFYVIGGSVMNTTTAGKTSECLVEYDLSSEFEEFDVNYMTVTVGGDVSGFVDGVNKLVLETANYRYEENITADELDGTVEINIENSPLRVTQDEQTVCLKLITDQLGFNTGNGNGSANFTLALSIDEAEGVSSNTDVAQTPVGTSENIAVKSVLVSDLDLLAGSSSLSAGADLAKFRVTADTWANNSSTSSQKAELGLNILTINYSESVTAGPIPVTDYILTNGNSSIAATSPSAGVLLFDLTGFGVSDRVMKSGGVETFTLELSTTTVINSDNDSITVEFDENKDGLLVYSVRADTTCASTACVNGGLRLMDTDYGKIITD